MKILFLHFFWQFFLECHLEATVDVAGEKMHFTWFSRRDGFSPTCHQILPSPLRGSGQGYGELVGENSISPGKPCEMHIFRVTKSLNRGINVNSALQSAKAAELMFIPRYKVFKPRN